MAASYCGADVVKLQKRSLKAIPKEVAERVRSDVHSFGATEYEHRKALEFGIGQHSELKDLAVGLGMQYTASAWDQESYDELVELGVPWIKIPSALNLSWLRWNLQPVLPVHVSLGMTTIQERNEILDNCKGDPPVVPYACTSTYPCNNEDTYLLEIPELKRRFSKVGFSGHHRGIALDIGAFLLGAGVIERHFTLDRAGKGTDHAASLEPEGLKKLCRDLKAVQSAWKRKPDDLPISEVSIRKKLKGL